MNPLKRCQNGHYYDSQKHSNCPFCGVQELNVDIRRTMAKGNHAANNEIPETRPMGGAGGQQPQAGQAPGKGGENRTVGMFKRKLGIEPVVGWVVAITGPEKGQDYRIVAEKNLIGRSESMDIAIKGDESISRESHAIISFNPKKQNFMLYPGDSKRLVYLNDEEVINPEKLKSNDIIEVGETQLIFVPLCGDNFKWNKEDNTVNE